MTHSTPMMSVLGFLAVVMPMLVSCGVDLDAISSVSTDEKSSLTGKDTSNQVLETD
jgi:hypothetical protein